MNSEYTAKRSAAFKGVAIFATFIALATLPFVDNLVSASLENIVFFNASRTCHNCISLWWYFDDLQGAAKP